MKTCRICGSPIEPFLTFGKMPRGNGFLRPDQFGEEDFFQLEAASCPVCTMVQLVEQPARERMFNDRYPFFTGSSQRMVQHFIQFAEQIIARDLRVTQPLVVEIGSNDGTMLAHFARAGIRHLGVEPSANVAQLATERGLRTMCAFFDEPLARRIVQEEGQADVVVAANVLCHVNDLHTMAEGIRVLLKPEGIFLVEDPYLGDVIEKTAYDQFYDEHAFFSSVASLSYLFQQHGLSVVNAQPQPTHGGSMRFSIVHAGSRPAAPAVSAALERETRLALHRPETYEAFRRRCEASREHLIALLTGCRNEGRRVVGYGATAKSTTVINYCGITPELVEFICDSTPLKQGTFSPGMHIPIRSPEAFSAPYPEFALLFAWNHGEEIMEKEQGFLNAGGRWMVYVPQVTVLSSERSHVSSRD